MAFRSNHLIWFSLTLFAFFFHLNWKFIIHKVKTGYPCGPEAHPVKKNADVSKFQQLPWGWLKPGSLEVHRKPLLYLAATLLWSSQNFFFVYRPYCSTEEENSAKKSQLLIPLLFYFDSLDYFEYFKSCTSFRTRLFNLQTITFGPAPQPW